MRLGALSKDAPPFLFRLDVRAINHYAQLGLRALVTYDVKLPFSALPITGKTRKFKKKCAAGRIARVSFHGAQKLLDRFVEFPRCEQLFGLHHNLGPHPRRSLIYAAGHFSRFCGACIFLNSTRWKGFFVLAGLSVACTCTVPASHARSN